MRWRSLMCQTLVERVHIHTQHIYAVNCCVDSWSYHDFFHCQMDRRWILQGDALSLICVYILRFFFQFSFPNITLSQQVSCPAVRLLLVRWNRSWRIWRRRKGCSQYGTGVIKQYKWLLRDFPYNSAIVWVGYIMTPAIRLPDLCCFSTCLVVCSWPWMQVDVAISKLFLVCRRRHLRQNASEKHIGNGHSF